MLELSETLRQIDHKLRHGDPASGWRGDPDLSLHLGQLRTTNGVLVEEKLEVWRHCEDGVDRCIAWWDIENFGRIIHDMRLMDLRSPSHVPTLERIDKHNAAKEREISQLGLSAEEALKERLQYEFGLAKRRSY